MKIFLVRHGETTGDVEDRYGGSYDDHLTKRGYEQLKATAQQLVNKGIEVIFTSPLIRARESANIIRNAIDAPVAIVDDLRERDYGILTGLTKQEAEQRYPEVVRLHADPHNTDPDGESYHHFHARVAEAFRSIATEPYKIIAVVSHGGPIKSVCRSLNKEVPSKLDDGHILEVEM